MGDQTWGGVGQTWRVSYCHSGWSTGTLLLGPSKFTVLVLGSKESQSGSGEPDFNLAVRSLGTARGRPTQELDRELAAAQGKQASARAGSGRVLEALASDGGCSGGRPGSLNKGAGDCWSLEEMTCSMTRYVS